MRRRNGKAKTLALALACALLPWQQGAVTAKADEQITAPQPAYLWDFEGMAGSDTVVESKGTANGAAELHGAFAQKQQISVGGKTYGSADNSVLALTGGDKGTSWAELPSDLYSGVSASTGLTWSFWMKPDAAVGSYSRLLSSADNSGYNEFAYAPYASDKVWNLIFDDDNGYKLVHGKEPAKGVWSYVTIAVSGEQASFYINGEEAFSSVGEGSAASLKTRLNGLAAITNHALGKTYSRWGDQDCKVQLDDVALYKTALTAGQVLELARSKGLEPKGPHTPQDAKEGVYGSEEKPLEQMKNLTVSSVDSANQVKIWTDSDGRYYYSVTRNGKVVIECSALGLTTKEEEFVSGMELDASSVSVGEGREQYDILQGSSSHVDKAYRELSFTLTKGSGKITVLFRVFADGVAYRYVVDADTDSSAETTTVTGEASEFVLPDKGDIWTIDKSATYECYEYTKRTVDSQYGAEANYSTPLLASLGADSGDAWVLLSEANVYNEENPYCGSVFQTDAGEKAIRVVFGDYLKQETDPAYDKKTYRAEYGTIQEVVMQGEFHTPWRTAVIASDLEGIANSSLFTDLNPAPTKDFSWVEPGASVWSWWSSSYDAIEYKTMQDYIDFAAETGMKYCLVDYGWELWENYQEKIASLVEYADTKGVSLLLWYGVNKFDNEHIFDLDSRERIEEAFAWCEEVGVKGVKVDYINSASQFAMNVMYLLADIAADHHLVLNYHGCINPSGENRTYPNILSSEAVAGMENNKWSSGSSVATLLTLPYTRNVLGSMEFTPTAYRVSSSPATSGFMLAQSVVYESAVQTFAHSAYVYQGYQGLSLIDDVPTSWDESRLLAGYPGENVIRARRKGDNWYLGAMTKDADTYRVKLDFLEAGETYRASIYKDNAAGNDIVVEEKDVTAGTFLEIPLLANGGCSVKFSKTDERKWTSYDNFRYYEAEDGNYAKLGGDARIADNPYASNLKDVGYVGMGGTLKFENITAPEDGEYTLRIYYVSGEARDFCLKVNGGEEIYLDGMIGYAKDWKAVAAVDVDVTLLAGDNEILLYHETEHTPNFDRIAVSKWSRTAHELASAQVALSQERYVESGTECRPRVTVTYGDEVLLPGVDYTVAYENNKKAGAAQAVITGIGSFSGTLKKSFTILPGSTEKPGGGDTEKPGGGSTEKPGGNDTQNPSGVPVAKVALNVSKLTLGVKETFRLRADVAPANATDKRVKYQSSNAKVVSVGSSTGKLTAKKTGKAKITVTVGKKKAVCKVTVKKAPKKIALNAKAKTLKKGRSFKIKAKLPKNTASHKLTYKSSKKSVAAVSASGVVKAKKKGSAVITVTTFNKKKAKLKIKVK